MNEPTPEALASACAFLEPKKLVALLGGADQMWTISRAREQTLAQAIVGTAVSLGWVAPPTRMSEREVFDRGFQRGVAECNVVFGRTEEHAREPLLLAVAEIAYREGYDLAERQFNDDHEAWEWPEDVLAELRAETLPRLIVRAKTE